MDHTQPPRSLMLCALAALLAVGAGPCLADAPAIESEHTQLALLLRQLDTIDRLIGSSEASSQLDRSRYSFNYPRLRSDIERIRGGIQQ